MYTLHEGHCYFDNVCIKIRYDLTSQKNNHLLTEQDIFDVYENVFDLKKNQVFNCNSPLKSLSSHRLAYIIED